MVQTPALDLIDQALVDVEEGRNRLLIVSMPPQEGKSQRVTRFMPEWLLTRNQDRRIAIVSYGDDIAGDMSYMIRSDITTFDGSNTTDLTPGEAPLDLGLRLRHNSRAVGRWYLEAPAKGGVYAVGIGGSLTSKPVDFMIIDDPVKDYRAADSEVLSEAAWNWWMAVARPRLAPGAPVVIVQTRWHENDLAGRLIAKQKQDEAAGETEYDRWTVLNIPAQAEYDPAKGETDPLGRKPGEFMISARGRTVAQWQATKVATAPRIWSAMYQGRPTPDTGKVWQRAWWRTYETLLWSVDSSGAYRVDADEVMMSWDFTFKDEKSSDFVVGQVWARRGAEVFLLDQIRRRLDFGDSITAMLAMIKKWPQATLKIVEDKANGPAVISTLRKKVPGIVPKNPQGSKYARAVAVSPFVRAGNVKLPSKDVALFDVDEFLEESAAFPLGTHDDQVDATSQALEHLLLDGAGADAWTTYLREKLAEHAQAAAAPDVPQVGEIPITAAEPTADEDAPDFVGMTPLQAARHRQHRLNNR